MVQRGWQVATAALMASLLAGCVQLNEEQQRAALLSELDGSLAQLQVNLRQLERRMDQLTEDKSCQQDQHCKVLAKGVRPCGGPEQFLTYSVLTTDETMLLHTSEQFSQLRQRQHQRLGTVSTCELLLEPVASCQQQSCTLQEQDFASR
ncbi:hypothetical protein [Alkalimonas amylolytica]|uniref:Lipoprotein n=1 Tax=Alkalimonas amylolytica TaxID=152573 RepID=A0A1H3ZR17_ALKAM|nr:hypothetical protein [Alkalimonas amylolytica]SEA26149.1 hypothetical protein SAMN04488051_102316 [Alkalimonas amylolytica]